VGFVVFVIVASSNAVNLTDGLDGLAIGCTVIAAGALAVLTYLSGHATFATYLELQRMPQIGELTIFCGAMVGSSIGFLWYNAHPAEIFMGDVGSLALGGAIGTVAVMIKQELLLPFIGGIFVIEALSVILQVGSTSCVRSAFLRWRRSIIILNCWVVGVEGDCALLDCVAGVCAVCADDVEIEIETPTTETRRQSKSCLFSPCLRGEMKLMELNNRRVLVVGLGKSGVASALFLKSRGARVTVSDAKPEAELRNEILLLLEHGITVETGGHGDRTFRGRI